MWSAVFGCKLFAKLCLTLLPSQAPLPMGFPRQEYWTGVPFLSPGDLPNLGIEPTFSTLQVDCLPLSHQGFWHLSNLLLSRTHHSSITSASLGVEMRLLDVFKFPSDSNMDPSLKTIQVLFFFFFACSREMASPTQWTWVWANSGRWWRTGKPGVVLTMGSQRVGHNWATEQHQLLYYILLLSLL